MIHKADLTPHLVVGTQGAVAVELKECSDAGLESKVLQPIDRMMKNKTNCSIVLKKGGSAVDSAIASALCIGVVNSFATGKLDNPSNHNVY